MILCDVVQGYYFSKPRMFNQIKDIIGKEIEKSIICSFDDIEQGRTKKIRTVV